MFNVCKIVLNQTIITYLPV